MSHSDYIISDCSNPQVDANAIIYDVLPRLDDSPTGMLDVIRDGIKLGTITSASAIHAIAQQINLNDETSLIVIECAPDDYCGSLVAHAVEDVNAHLLDLASSIADDGKMRISVRIAHRDPQAAIRSLERYGFSVVDAYPANAANSNTLNERLAALQVFLNV